MQPFAGVFFSMFFGVRSPDGQKAHNDSVSSSSVVTDRCFDCDRLLQGNGYSSEIEHEYKAYFA